MATPAGMEKKKKGFLSSFYMSKTKGSIKADDGKSITEVEAAPRGTVAVQDQDAIVRRPVENENHVLQLQMKLEEQDMTSCSSSRAREWEHNNHNYNCTCNCNVGGRREIRTKAPAPGRRSVSHMETASSLSVGAFLQLQVKVLVADMPGFMQVHAVRCARRTYDSLDNFSSKHMAYNMKKEFDKVYGPAWHCIVGSSFGSFVTHATGCFLYFSVENLYILLFKTKVQKTASVYNI